MHILEQQEIENILMGILLGMKKEQDNPEIKLLAV